MLHISLALYGHVFRILWCGQTKQQWHLYCSGDVMLVCLESLQRLGAKDMQADNPAGFACPVAPCFLCPYWTALEAGVEGTA